MQEKRKERESRTTAVFEPPGYEDVFRVEMQVIGYSELSEMALAHERQRHVPTRNLYVAAVLEHAPEADGGSQNDVGGDWVSIARLQYPELPVDSRARVALIRLLEGQGVTTLANDWNEWNTHGNGAIEQEVRRDFSQTR